MRRISSTYIYPVSSQPLKYGIISLNQESAVSEVFETGGVLSESSSLEYYNGIIVPGFLSLDCLSSEPDVPTIQKGRLSYENGIRASLVRVERGSHNSIDRKFLHRSFTAGNYDDKGQELNFPELLSEEEVRHLIVHKTNYKAEKHAFLTLVNPCIVKISEECQQFSLWYVINSETLKLFDHFRLASFFKRNKNRIILSWNAGKPVELLSLLSYFLEPSSGLTLQEVIQTISLNPARVAGYSGLLGEIKTGLIPGVNLIEGIDFKRMLPSGGELKIKRLA